MGLDREEDWVTVRCCGLWQLDVIGREHHPSHPCVWIRQRHEGAVGASSSDQRTAPLTSSVLLALAQTQCGPGTMHQELTPIPITACAHPAPTRFAPGGVLAWAEPQPGCQR